jgi:hypothetical protein
MKSLVEVDIEALMKNYSETEASGLRDYFFVSEEGD